jgi:hypothetical protein
MDIVKIVLTPLKVNRLSRCRHQWDQECPEGLAWAGWQAHWRI